MSEPVSVTTADSITTVRVDDGKANALSKQIIGSLLDAVVDADADAEVKAIVIVGRDGVMSGGFDLNVMRSGDAGAIVDLVADGGELVRTCYAAGTPIIAACTGHAVAAGALLLLGCDVRIGSAGAFNIGLPEVNIGMALPSWALTISAERLSRRHLQRAAATGEMYAPDAAVDAGFLDEVVDAKSVVDRATAIAKRYVDAMHVPAYASTIERLRAETLATMESQIAADRSG